MLNQCRRLFAFCQSAGSGLHLVVFFVPCQWKGRVIGFLSTDALFALLVFCDLPVPVPVHFSLGYWPFSYWPLWTTNGFLKLSNANRCASGRMAWELWAERTWRRVSSRRCQWCPGENWQCGEREVGPGGGARWKSIRLRWNWLLLMAERGCSRWGREQLGCLADAWGQWQRESLGREGLAWGGGLRTTSAPVGWGMHPRC